MLPLAVRRSDDAIPFPLIDRLRLGDQVTVIARHGDGAVAAIESSMAGRPG